MMAATKKLSDMYNARASRSSLEGFIIDLYSGMDGTTNKVYSAQLAKNLRAMNDSEFDLYIQNAIKDKLKLIAAPFQGDKMDQLKATASKLGCKLAETFVIPELGPNVKTKYPVAWGWEY